MPGTDPHIETLEPWVSVGVRNTVPMAELSSVFAQTYEKVAAAVGTAGARLVGPAYAEYFGMPTDTVDVEIGFGVDRAVEVPGFAVTERPGGRAVVATHVGPYDKLEESYAELMPWLEMESVELTESMFEFYDSEPDEDPATTVTRLVFPLA
jgi:effector-binding domain-containing protein